MRYVRSFYQTTKYTEYTKKIYLIKKAMPYKKNMLFQDTFCVFRVFHGYEKNGYDTEIRIAHYPPYPSKYKQTEHRLFPHITRACKGAIFKTVDMANDLIGMASTSKGLKVFSSVLDKTFETGRKYADDFKKKYEN